MRVDRIKTSSFTTKLLISIFVLVCFQLLTVGSAQANNIYSQDAKNKLDTIQAKLTLISNTYKISGASEHTPQQYQLRQMELQNAYDNGFYYEVMLLSNQLYAELQQYESSLNREAVQDAKLKNTGKPANIPILMYHKLPKDFALQLDEIRSKGYQTISMAEVSDYLDGKYILPNKPIVITFDDGYSDQLESINMLKERNMKATYYIIIGGEKSNLCIGLLKNNTNCGDSYLTIEQIKMMKLPGVAEIGSHTLDHKELTKLNPSDKLDQIKSSKETLENMLGTTITTFAFPYGKFDELSTKYAEQSGYKTAVTTMQGSRVSPDNRYMLQRTSSIKGL